MNSFKTYTSSVFHFLFLPKGFMFSLLGTLDDKNRNLKLNKSKQILYQKGYKFLQEFIIFLFFIDLSTSEYDFLTEIGTKDSFVSLSLVYRFSIYYESIEQFCKIVLNLEYIIRKDDWSEKSQFL